MASTRVPRADESSALSFSWMEAALGAVATSSVGEVGGHCREGRDHQGQMMRWGTRGNEALQIRRLENILRVLW